MLREHKPHLEDSWADCIDEFEVRRRDWSRLTLDQMRIYHLGWKLPNLVDDYTNLVDHVFAIENTKPLSDVDWSVYEMTDIKTRSYFVLHRSQLWLNSKVDITWWCRFSFS